MLQSASFQGRKTFSRPCNDFDDFGVPSSDDEKELLNLGRYASATARRRQIKKAQVVDPKPAAKPETIKAEESPKQTQVVVPSKPGRKSWADVASDDEDMTDFAWTTQEASVNDAKAIVNDEKPTQSTNENWSWSTAATDSLEELVPDLYVPGAKQTTEEEYLSEQQERVRQQELLAEQMRQIQLVQMRQEQMRQEQLHQEQLRQEQLRKEQLRQEQLQLERLQQQKQQQLQQQQQQQQQAQMQMQQQLQLQMQQVQGQMQTQGQAQQTMLVALPMNFMPMMMPSNQMQMNPQNALGYPEDEEQQQEQQAKAIVPKYAEGPIFGSTHRFHQKNSSMGVLSQDARTFTKSSNKGRLSIICENRVHFSGVSRYAVQFTEGELCSADGVGFILSSDLPCTKNIQRIVSVFANRTGRICVRVHEEVERCSQRVKCLEVGDWLEVISDLDNQTVSFVVWPEDGSRPSWATVSFAEILSKARGRISGLPRAPCGYLAVVIKCLGVSVKLGS
eukprot:CAMPEP_0181525510 /NCGR_PEP_ID=MMETSP1110-20121109/69005_1 /TAXON_ID=174948 /ORGANISM="Symbiodinium sp., Strain CCMP421" /LENGTH=504 /DNA_ID=CAMNT_0023656317 /DNA_START=74 /DNA_END=1588 /DNA_ORIENTATION=-